MSNIIHNPAELLGMGGIGARFTTNRYLITP